MECQGSSLLLYLPVILVGGFLVVLSAFSLICRQRRKRVVVAAKRKQIQVTQRAEMGMAYLEAHWDRLSNMMSKFNVRGRILISLFQVLCASYTALMCIGYTGSIGNAAAPDSQHCPPNSPSDTKHTTQSTHNTLLHESTMARVYLGTGPHGCSEQ